MTTLLGGIKFTATKLDGSTEEIFIRQLPIKEFPVLRDHLGDELAMLEIYCAQPKGWAAMLMPASHDAVITEAEKLNRDFFLRWVERQKARAAMIPKPDMGEVVQMLDALSKSNPDLLNDLMKKAVAGSPISLPMPPAPAG